MTTPTPPPATDPGQPAPGQPVAPAAPALTTPPAAPPVPQPPTWTPPPPPVIDDGGLDDISKLPKKWQKELTDARSDAAKYRVQARTETVLRHAYTTATEHGVNPAALLGSTVFAEFAKALDPSAEDFPAKLADAIKNALAANPWMAAQAANPAAPTAPPVPPQSGGDFSGSGGHQTQSLDQQIAEAEKNRDFATAIALKRQRAALTQTPPTS
ncbi:hypothetical protein ABT340_04720 [Streptosporangium sp. NPDC000239]|uniref:hypothetical protein n=1 Tax=Streptosporangium sp. NPDC000239 TaxID=3154248 RepID=UPI003316BCDF